MPVITTEDETQIDFLNNQSLVYNQIDLCRANANLLLTDEKELDFETLKKDISLWPQNMTSYVDKFLQIGPVGIQNKDSKIIELKSVVQEDEKNIRTCNVVQNREEIDRSWLCFSPLTGKMYCFHCKLYKITAVQLATEGFCD